jgi:transposase-like protein
MARLYAEQGLSYEQIAEEYGISRQRVGQILQPLGLAQARGPAARAQREQKLRVAYERINAGAITIDRAAAELGYTKAHSLRDALRRIGLTISTVSVPEHGTWARYSSRSHTCRCDECRRANRERAQALRDSGDPPKHGYSGYKNYGCRCKVCKEANRLAVRAERAARRQRREVTI